MWASTPLSNVKGRTVPLNAAAQGSGSRAPPTSSEISTSTSALREHVTRYTCERVTETQREEEIGARQSSALMRRRGAA